MGEGLAELLHSLETCPPGHLGWQRFEDVCTRILTELFVPPLQSPRIQARSYLGTDRRDAIFPNRNLNSCNNWGHMYTELRARLILVEFKNYDTTEIGKHEVIQTGSYLNAPMGSLALMVCSKPPGDSAHRKRNSLYSETGKVVLFLTKEHLREMTHIRERGEDPSDLIMDLIEEFYVQHE